MQSVLKDDKALAGKKRVVGQRERAGPQKQQQKAEEDQANLTAVEAIYCTARDEKKGMRSSYSPLIPGRC